MRSRCACDAVRVPFYRMQVVLRLVPGVYQSLIYLLVARSPGSAVRDGDGSCRRARRGGPAACACRDLWSAGVGLLRVCTQDVAVSRARPAGAKALCRVAPAPRPRKATGRCDVHIFGDKSGLLTCRPADTFGYHVRGLPRLRRWASSARRVPEIDLVQICLASENPRRGRYLIDGISAHSSAARLAHVVHLSATGTTSVACFGRRQHPFLPRTHDDAVVEHGLGSRASTQTS